LEHTEQEAPISGVREPRRRDGGLGPVVLDRLVGEATVITRLEVVDRGGEGVGRVVVTQDLDLAAALPDQEPKPLGLGPVPAPRRHIGAVSARSGHRSPSPLRID
jgi:hypothetical protein